MAGGQRDESISPTEEKRLGRDEQCTGMLLHGCECRLEFGVCADRRDMELPPDGADGFLHFSLSLFGIWILRVYQKRDSCG